MKKILSRLFAVLMLLSTAVAISGCEERDKLNVRISQEALEGTVWYGPSFKKSGDAHTISITFLPGGTYSVVGYISPVASDGKFKATKNVLFLDELYGRAPVGLVVEKFTQDELHMKLYNGGEVILTFRLTRGK